MNKFSKSSHSNFLFLFSTIGKPFHFRGCGWPQNKELIWSLDDKQWIVAVNNLFTLTFGEDYLAYEWDKGKRSVIISPESIPSYNCDNYALWESALKSLCPSTQSGFSGTPILAPSLSPKSAITLKDPPRWKHYS